MGQPATKIGMISGLGLASKSDSGKSESVARIRQFLETIEPEVIIECPACQTKFRVEASKLGSGDSSSQSDKSSYDNSRAKARFHCSRCDYVFAAEVATSPQVQSQEQHTSNEEPRSFQHEIANEQNSLNQYNYEDTMDSSQNNNSSIDIVAEVETEKPDSSQATEQQQLSLNFTQPKIDSTKDFHISEPAFNLPEVGTFETPVVDIGWPDQNYKSAKSDIKPEEVESGEQTESTEIVNTETKIDDFGQDIESDQHRLQEELENMQGTAYLDPDSVGRIVSSLNINAAPLHNSTPFQDPAPLQNHTVETPEIEATRVQSSFDFDSSTANNQFSSPTQPSQDYSRYAQDYSHEEEDRRMGLQMQPSLNADSARGDGPISENLFSPSTKAATFFGAKEKLSSGNSTSKTLAVFIFPLICVLTLLGASTLYMGNNIKSGEKLLGLLYPNAMREVPSGVFIQQPRLEPLVLDNGDIVNVVYGTIVNQSKKTLSALAIEGLGFSDAGDITSSEKILIGNPVSNNNATLKTLSPSDIRDLQTKQPTNFQLRPDNKVKFVLVFTKPVNINANTNKVTGSKDDRIASFAVRVHSARFRD